MIIQTEAIVIRSTKYSDSDCILTLFTRKMGKLGVYSKNARLLKSPLMSGSQIFAYSNVTINTRDGKYRLSNADLISNFYKLSSKMEKTYLGYYMIELVEKLSMEGQSNIRLFQLLADSLGELQNNDNIILMKTIFELKILDYTGYRPNASRCIVCGNNQNLGNYFAPGEGGRVCTKCLNQVRLKYMYDTTTFRLIEYIQSNHISKILEAKINDQIIQELSIMLDYYIKYHLSEVKIKTREYLILD
ncbi:DNA repair protein RecO [Proteocatella sphenisci]|uniref:DNA repair protein RecO n=1 Tax=Proteocatella sphenisci TaxID=181070 RepID=UPI00048F8927|nr:DNA repair protein RecO [Proteocatella sphenisci]